MGAGRANDEEVAASSKTSQLFVLGSWLFNLVWPKLSRMFNETFKYTK